MIEDKLLILRFKQGRHEALRQIYDKYKVELLRLAVVLVGDVNTAEDMVHDVFVKFARSADRIKITGNLKNYLITSVINRVRNHLRDSNRHRETKLDGAELLAACKLLMNLAYNHIDHASQRVAVREGKQAIAHAEGRA